MAPDNKTNSRPKAKLKLRIGALIYGILFVYALLLTQLLRNPISNVFFWFMFTAAPVSFVLMLIGKAVIQVYVHADVTKCEKMSPTEYELRIINQSPIIYPSVEAIVYEPSEDCIRSEAKKLVLTLTPFGGYIVKRKLSFKYRGFYELGVSELYITDALRLFRLRVDIDNYSNITVVPRKLDLDDAGSNSVSDVPSRYSRMLDVRDMSEVNNIREYRMGDPLKSIHWKLSSKAEDLQVKEFNTNNDSHTYVLLDNSAPSPAPEIEAMEAKKRLSELLKLQKSANGEKSGIPALIEIISERIRQSRNNRLIAKGKTNSDIETRDAIDALIRETSAHGKAAEAKKAAKQETARANVDEGTIKHLEELIKEGNVVTSQEKLAEALDRWGGVVSEEYADEMPEYTVDAVVEIATSVVAKELQKMHDCTVLCFSENGADVYDVKDTSDFDGMFAHLASVPVVPHQKHVADLSGAVNDSLNVTIKIITSNLDPVSVAKYASVPSMFGGSGVGCSMEIFLFNPYVAYEKPKVRLEYAQAAAQRLKHYGIDLYDVREDREGENVILKVTEMI